MTPHEERPSDNVTNRPAEGRSEVDTLWEENAALRERGKGAEEGLEHIALFGCCCDSDDPEGLQGDERCCPHQAQDILLKLRDAGLGKEKK